MQWHSVAVVVGGYMCMVSLFLPWFSTPLHGGWMFKDYPLLMSMAGFGVYVAPPIAAALCMLGALIGTAVPARILAILAAIVGILGTAFTLFVNWLFLHLFFDQIVAFKIGMGFFVDVAAHLLVVIGSVWSIVSPPVASPPSASTPSGRASKAEKETGRPTLGGTKVVSSSSGELRKRQTVGEAKPSPTKVQKVEEKDQKKPDDGNKEKKEHRKPSSAFPSRVFAAVHLALLVGLMVTGGLNLVPPVHYGQVVDHVTLPPGFSIQVVAENIKDARSLALGQKGILFVGTRDGGSGKVYAIMNKRGDDVRTIVEGLFMPNGVALKDGALYLAEVSKLWKFPDIENKLLNNKPLEKVLLRDNWPSDHHHGWKFIRFGPDGKLYVPVGAPCNVCERKDERYASIMAIDVSKPNSDGDYVYAHGVRNSVGFDWHPKTGALWFTENGRDFASEDFPPDELNTAPTKGLHFGFPYCYGQNVPDPETNLGHNCSQLYKPSARDLEPHVAAVGARFYTGSMFPARYKNLFFFAEHGSWNRQNPSGYRIMVSDVTQNPPTYEIFASGFVDGRKIYGRPVDIEVMPDGSLLFSDDYANKIYRISYSK